MCLVVIAPISDAFILPSLFLKTASSLSLRATGRAVGMGSTLSWYT